MTKTVYNVGQLNRYIKNMFTQDYLLASVLVRGEISNCKRHSSGHIYFTLKDETGTISCVMFASFASRMNFEMQNGQQVVVAGNVDIYERDGKYQLYAKQIVLDGAGLLSEAFEQMKRELEEEGMFAPEYKKPIPKYPKVLGVVTAPTGAAVRDIIQVATRRNPYIQIVLFPALVQGASAAPSIVEGIRTLEQYGVDLMIIGRGGGSMEDLWAFNEREVAQAIFDCSVPIISAVGHETDFTIADFVSDLRAPTPSAAAELAVSEVAHVLDQLQELEMRFYRDMIRVIRAKQDQVALGERQLRLVHPMARVQKSREDLLSMEERISQRMEKILREKKQIFQIYCERMNGLSPLRKLSSGFSYVEDENGYNLRSVEGLQSGDLITVHMTDGKLQAQVLQTEKANK